MEVDLDYLKKLGKSWMYEWTQQDTDVVRTYLYSRGWQPPKRYEGKAIVSYYVDPVKRRREYSPNAVSIDEALFKDPNGGYCRVQEALRRALSTEKAKSRIKHKLDSALELLDKGDPNGCREELEGAIAWVWNLI